VRANILGRRAGAVLAGLLLCGFGAVRSSGTSPCPFGWTVTNLTHNRGVLSELPGEYSAIASAGATVYVIYTTLGAVDIRSSADGGVHFGPALSIGSDAQFGSARVAVHGANVYATWTQAKGTKSFIAVATSRNGGATWSAPVQVSAPESDAAFEAINVPAEDANVYVPYVQDKDIFVSVSHDRGATFARPVQLTQNSAPYYAQEIAIVNAGGHVVYVVYERDQDGVPLVGGAPANQVYSRTSTDGGTTWAPEVDIARNSAGNAAEPLISTQPSAATGDVFAIWRLWGASGSQVFTSYTADVGAMWSTPLDIGTKGVYARTAAIASNGQNVFGVWRELVNGSYDVVISASHDSAKTWRVVAKSGPTGQHSLGNYEEDNPWIVADQSTEAVYAAWDQYPSGSTHLGIFLTASADNGQTWSAPQEVGTELATSHHAMLLAGQSPTGAPVPLLAWERLSGSTQDVFFATCATTARSIPRARPAR